MAIYVYTGKLGSGKTLCAVGRMRDYLFQNRKVVSNIDLYLEKLLNPSSKKCQAFRIPDRPVMRDLEMLGQGYDGDYRGEEYNGLIVLDECAQFLNTRNFQDKERKKITGWFVHARKKRWDVIFIIQHLNALDKQFRDMFAEHIVYCNRMDRLRFPFGIRHFFQLLGFSGNLPKIHRALVMYGSTQNAMKVETFIYTGKDLYNTYSTEQGFNDENDGAIYQLIPPYYTHGRYTNDWSEFKRNFKSWLSRPTLKARQFFSLGLLLGIVGISTAQSNYFQNEETIISSLETKEFENVKEVLDVQINHQKDVDYYRITGSLIGTVHSELFFEKNDRPFYPVEEGYRYLIVNKCQAKLIKNKINISVFCEPARTRQRVTVSQNNGNTLTSKIVESVL